MQPARLLIQLCLQEAYRQTGGQADSGQLGPGKPGHGVRTDQLQVLPRSPATLSTPTKYSIQIDPHHQPTPPTFCSCCAHLPHMSRRGGACCSASGRFNRREG